MSAPSKEEISADADESHGLANYTVQVRGPVTRSFVTSRFSPLTLAAALALVRQYSGTSFEARIVTDSGLIVE